jgi:hypothetical protein
MYLGLCEFNKHLCSGVHDSHLVQDGRAVVGDDHLAIGRRNLRAHSSACLAACRIAQRVTRVSHAGIRQRTILSMPRGPRLVRTASATALAASMLDERTSFFLVVSLRKQNAVCYELDHV